MFPHRRAQRGLQLAKPVMFELLEFVKGNDQVTFHSRLQSISFPFSPSPSPCLPFSCLLSPVSRLPSPLLPVSPSLCLPFSRLPVSPSPCLPFSRLAAQNITQARSNTVNKISCCDATLSFELELFDPKY